MKASTIVARGAALAGPIAVLAIPKCPLCLLPLLAALGVALPSGPLLDVIVIAVVSLWALFAPAPRVPALLAGAIVIAGRLAAIAVLSWLGVAIMIAIAAIRIFGRERTCKYACERTTESWRTKPITHEPNDC